MRTSTFELEGYIIEHTHTESSYGGVLLYIDHHINYKVCNNLRIYKAKELESIFIEILNQNSKNTIIGCIYRHLCMDPAEFNHVCLHDVLEKLSNENNTVVLMGDFNIDLLEHDSNIDSSAFLDKMHSSFFLPYISSPSRLTTQSQTLIDNIFSNNIEENINSGNLTSTISDHYAQFLLFENTNSPNKDSVTEKLQHSFKSMNEEKFKYELNRLD